ncbi:MAG: hypothetical protein IJB85_03860 [Clostridia bacterium]|nr:hypothetical protein [Clostridia bacterium]
MRIDLLGLELDRALVVLADEGITPRVVTTCAPRRREEICGVLRVVYASDDGERLTVSRFLDPIADSTQENA